MHKALFCHIKFTITDIFTSYYILSNRFFINWGLISTHYNINMRITYHIAGLLALALATTGCQRENDIVDPLPLPTGGTGGKATLVVTPQHHKININDAVVYIKYGTSIMPAMDQFDDTEYISFDLGRPTVTFPGLTQGDYYIYAEGTDYKLEPGKDKINGGAHFKVIDTFAKTYDLYLQMDNPIHHEK